MKIKSMELNNFAKFSKLEVEFNDQVTHLVGMNGAGKSTIGVTAIQACLKGIAEKNKDGQLIGERFRFIGPAKKSADIILTIVDEAKGGAEIIVRNKITESANNISFEAPDGYDLGNGWLNNLFNVSFLSAKNFSQLSPKEQALLLGIDVSKEDKDISDAKADITIINREIKGYGVLEPVEPVESVSVTELLQQKKAIDSENEIAKSKNSEIERIQNGILEFKSRKEELEAELADINNKIEKGEAWLAKAKVIPMKPTDHIEKQLEEVESINRKASDYARYKEKKDALDSLNVQLKTAKEKVSKLEQARADKIQSFNFGFEGLNVDESGGLLLNGRPIKDPYYSKGELELIVAKLYVSMNPTLKMRFIDDFDLIDEDNQAKLIKELLDAGFQIITAEVGRAKEGENVLIIREGRVFSNNEKGLGV